MARWDGPVTDLAEPGKHVRGISGKAAILIGEILRTGTAGEYENLLRPT